MQTNVEMGAPDQDFNFKLWAMSRYVDSCFAVTGAERPTDWSEQWGMICHFACRGEVASFAQWSKQNGINIVGVTPERIQAADDAMGSLMASADDAERIDMTEKKGKPDGQGGTEL